MRSPGSVAWSRQALDAVLPRHLLLAPPPCCYYCQRRRSRRPLAGLPSRRLLQTFADSYHTAHQVTRTNGQVVHLPPSPSCMLAAWIPAVSCTMDHPNRTMQAQPLITVPNNRAYVQKWEAASRRLSIGTRRSPCDACLTSVCFSHHDDADSPQGGRHRAAVACSAA